MDKGHHPKLVARGNEAEDAGLKFKGAPSDDCDPFAIQNYIDRLASDVYDYLYPAKDNEKAQEKDEWELMKEKAKNVPFQDVTLSIALKHGLMDEVKKENANKPFEKDSILTIMKVRDEFLHDYPDANGFEYQWQIWVEWERHLKHIGVTIPQWGKIARKLIRLGVELIQQDMAKKYTQISAGSNKRKQDPEDGQERRRRVTLPSDTPPPFGSPGVGSFAAPIIHRSHSFGGYMDAPFSTVSFASHPPTPYSTTPSTPIYSAPSTPNPNDAPSYSPMQSPVSTSAPLRGPFESAPQTFGASLYNMIHAAPPTATNIFAAPIAAPMRSPSLSSPHTMETTLPPSGFTQHYSAPTFSNTSASLPYPYEQQQPSYGPPTHVQTYIPQAPSISSYPIHTAQMQYSAPTSNISFSPSSGSYIITSPPTASPSIASSPNPVSYMVLSPPSATPSLTSPSFQISSLSSPPPANTVLPSPGFQISSMSSPAPAQYLPQQFQKTDSATHTF